MRTSPGVSVREQHTSFKSSDTVWALYFAMNRCFGDTLVGDPEQSSAFKSSMIPAIEYFVERLPKLNWFIHAIDEMMAWRIIRVYREYGSDFCHETVLSLCLDYIHRFPGEVQEWYYKHAMFNPTDIICETKAFSTLVETMTGRVELIVKMVQECDRDLG